MPSATHQSLFAQLRKGDAGMLARCAGSMASACGCVAIVLLAAWVVATQQSRRLRDDDIGVAFAVATIPWLLSLLWIWRGGQSRRMIAGACVFTGLMLVCAILLGVTIDYLVRFNSETLIISEAALATGIVVWYWATVLARLRMRKPVLNADDLVDVRCPECSYSLIGMTELRCPECGTRFTLDEVIRRQGYDHARSFLPDAASPATRRLQHTP